MFEAVRGISFTGDIAIDDVNLLDGACNAPGACNFEKPICTWSNTQVEFHLLNSNKNNNLLLYNFLTIK